MQALHPLFYEPTLFTDIKTGVVLFIIVPLFAGYFLLVALTEYTAVIVVNSTPLVPCSESGRR